MIYGVSGITDINLKQGLNLQTGIFDKSKTAMDEMRYINYCRIGDKRQIQHIINERRRVLTKPSEGIGIDMVIEDFGIILHSEDFLPLVHAMSYPLHYAENYQNKFGILSPMLMVFKIGEHRVNDIKYLSDRPILGRKGNKRNYVCSDNDFEDYSGYHLEPGIVKVNKVLEIKEEKEGNAELGNALKPFRLVDVSRKFGLTQKTPLSSPDNSS